jgi:hypothetical protein
MVELSSTQILRWYQSLSKTRWTIPYRATQVAFRCPVLGVREVIPSPLQAAVLWSSGG